MVRARGFLFLNDDACCLPGLSQFTSCNITRCTAYLREAVVCAFVALCLQKWAVATARGIAMILGDSFGFRTSDVSRWLIYSHAPIANSIPPYLHTISTRVCRTKNHIYNTNPNITTPTPIPIPPPSTLAPAPEARTLPTSPVCVPSPTIPLDGIATLPYIVAYCCV